MKHYMRYAASDKVHAMTLLTTMNLAPEAKSRVADAIRDYDEGLGAMIVHSEEDEDGQGTAHVTPVALAANAPNEELVPARRRSK